MTKLIGTDTNQVPTNGDLGDLAYQNKESVRVDNLTIDSNVGIGTTAPGAELDVNGDIHADGISFDSGTNTLDYYEEGGWTPTLTFNTAGNLNVVYTIRTGKYIRIGSVVFLSCVLRTSTFTHTTASGDCQVTGFPFTTSAVSNTATTFPLSFGGITKAIYTNFTIEAAQNSTKGIVLAGGSGQSRTTVSALDMPTGGQVDLRFSGVYFI